MNISITEEWLKENGFEEKYLNYQIGGGEDEDTRYYWQKDNIVLAYESTYKGWYKSNPDKLNYINGFPSDEIITTIDEIYK